MSCIPAESDTVPFKNPVGDICLNKAFPRPDTSSSEKEDEVAGSSEEEEGVLEFYTQT